MNQTLFKPVASEKLSEKAQAQIENLINSGALKPGDKLPTERDLSLQLRLSRSVLREALKTLESLGYLYRKPGGGTFVREISEWNGGLILSDVIRRATYLDYLEAREMLEQKVVELVIERATDQELDDLGEIIALMERADAYSENLLQFHHKLVSLTKNVVLINFMLTNWQLHKNLVITNNVDIDFGRPHASMAEHRAILNAIKLRNVKLAQQAVVHHLTRVRNHLQAILAQA